MKVFLLPFTLLVFIEFYCFAQDGSEFDFWVGKWDLSWEYRDGTQGEGTNHMVKTLNDKVIHENFEATDDGLYQGFKGTSISVFNPNSKTWHQAWADNQGGYFNFIGEVGQGKRIFKTNPTVIDGSEIIQRMRFYNIEENSFTWDWERSADGGKTWSLQWRINYRRAQ